MGDRMERSAQPDNQRTRLTKRLIVEAFLRLLHKTSFNHITVSAICQEAQINRTTFYRYYDNQFQLLETIENDLIANMEEHGDICDLLLNPDKGRSQAEKSLIEMLETIEENMDLYHTLVTHVSPNIFEKSEVIRIESTMRALDGKTNTGTDNRTGNEASDGTEGKIVGKIDGRTGGKAGGKMDPKRTRLVADFIVGGGQKMLAEWIAQGPDRPRPDDMAKLLIDLIEGSLM